jgi:hypothetical protein
MSKGEIRLSAHQKDEGLGFFWPRRHDRSRGAGPLGLVIIGGLLVSLILTLYLTPVLYLELERLRKWVHRKKLK